MKLGLRVRIGRVELAENLGDLGLGEARARRFLALGAFRLDRHWS